MGKGRGLLVSAADITRIVHPLAGDVGAHQGALTIGELPTQEADRLTHKPEDITSEPAILLMNPLHAIVL